jgi:Trp operon repressor
VDRDDLKKVRRVELHARLELLDELIRDQARRAELVSEMGRDATPYKQRSNLLRASRQQYVEELRQLLCNEAVRDEDAKSGPSVG